MNITKPGNNFYEIRKMELENSMISEIPLEEETSDLETNDTSYEVETIVKYLENHDSECTNNEKDNKYHFFRHKDFFYENSIKALDSVNNFFTVKKIDNTENNIKVNLQKILHKKRESINKNIENFTDFIHYIIKWNNMSRLLTDKEQPYFKIDEPHTFFDQIREMEDDFIMVNDEINYFNIKNNHDGTTFISENNGANTEDFNFFQGKINNGEPHGVCLYRANNEDIFLGIFNKGIRKSKHILNSETLKCWSKTRLQAHDKMINYSMDNISETKNNTNNSFSLET